jgi:hypothetical protein
MLPDPFVIADCRRPGAAMANIPLKLPAAEVAQLQAEAERLGTSRTALGRHLLLQGLSRHLEQRATVNTTAQGVV